MKYENLKAATKLCEKIDEVNDVLNVLKQNEVTIAVCNYARKPVWHYSPYADPAQWPEMPIDLTAKFLNNLVQHYNRLRDQYHKELESL